MEITLSVSKQQVLDEVAKTTAYSGAKMKDDESAYSRIFTKKSDRDILDRFWNEAEVSVCEALKRFLVEEREEEGAYLLRLCLSESFDASLVGSMEKELMSYFVMSITGKWFAFTNKGEAGEYSSTASGLLEGLRKKVLYKKRPTRPRWNQ